MEGNRYYSPEASAPITAETDIVRQVPDEAQFIALVEENTKDPDAICNARVVYLHKKAAEISDAADQIEMASSKSLRENRIALIQQRTQAAFMRVKSRMIRESCPPQDIRPLLQRMLPKTAP